MFGAMNVKRTLPGTLLVVLVWLLAVPGRRRASPASGLHLVAEASGAQSVRDGV